MVRLVHDFPLTGKINYLNTAAVEPIDEDIVPSRSFVIREAVKDYVEAF